MCWFTIVNLLAIGLIKVVTKPCLSLDLVVSCYDVIITKKVSLSHGGQASCQVWLMHIPIIKSTVMQIQKALINHRLRVSEVL